MIERLRRDETGQATLAVTIMVALAVVALIGGVLIPIGLNSINEDRTTELNQSVSDTYEIGAFNSTVTATTSGTDATVELGYSGETISNTVNVGSTQTYSFTDGSVDVTVVSAESSIATVNYTYSSDFGYSDGATSIWGILDLIVVLAVFMFVIGIALSARGRV